MQILLEIDELYGECYTVMARSHGVSRRQYMVDLLTQAADNVPGLVEMVKEQMSGNISVKLDASMAVPQSKESKIKERIRRYRFTYRDESLGFIEGVGEAAGPALVNATGRSWPYEEYIAIFLEPQLLGYVE